MSSVNERLKQTCVLILAQTACVGVGLWMQHRHAVSSLRNVVEERAWGQMTLCANEITSKLDPLTLTDLTPGNAVFDHARVLLQRSRPDQGGVLVADAQRRVLVDVPACEQDDVPRLSAGVSIPWVPSSEPPNEGGGLERGTLDLPNGPHLAVCCALDGGKGYLLVDYPQAAIESDLAALARPLPANALVALSWIVAMLTVSGVVILGRLHDRAEQQRARSASEALRQTETLVRTRDSVIFGLAKLAESRDDDTGQHLDRISAYATVLASALRRHPKYAHEATPGFVRLIAISSVLHDIGKVGIEDKVLLKPGPLDAPERARMEHHAVIGGECLREIEQRLGSTNFLQMARQIAFSHHERWDGTGYPKGLAGEAIPLAARIVAIADVYDALSFRRVYKPPFPHEKCLEIIRDEAGKTFDPDLVEVWLTVESRYREIALRYAATLPPSELGDVYDADPAAPTTQEYEFPAPLSEAPIEAEAARREISMLR